MASATKHDPLSRYAEKRNFKVTSEPRAKQGKQSKSLSFVIQKHWASRLHYDFRLELDGVLLSWAVPKGPSFDPKQKRMAIHVEDHPTEYGSFEGTIPAKQYGAGTVLVWDRGTWEPVGDPREGMKVGKVLFKLHGEKLAGLWELVRISKPDSRQDQWILFKKKDEWARPIEDFDVISALPDSVVDKPLGQVELREPRSAEPRNPISRGTADAPIARGEVGVKAPMPDTLSPQLATLTHSLPAGNWVYEVKFDGYRVMARIVKGSVRLLTRGGHDWTDKMRAIADALLALQLKSAWLDGEIVVLDQTGIPNFNALQNAFDSKNTVHITYFVFDMPYFNGRDLRKVPLLERKSALQAVLEKSGSDLIRYAAHFQAEQGTALQSACEMKLEGLIAKRTDAAYVSSRTDSWLKLKCTERQEFVILGFTPRKGSIGEVGALLLGYYQDGKIRYAGNVGTGWSAAESARLFEKLVRIETDTPAIDPQQAKPGRWSKRASGEERWVKPLLVAEIAFAEWTPDGHARHASYKGLRSDKPAKSVVRELPKQLHPMNSGRSMQSAITSVKVSHGDRIIDDSTGLTKLDLVRYYEGIAERLLPHLRDRPVTLVRAPSGIGGQQFFQKHDEKLSIPGIKALDPRLWEGHAALLEVPNEEAIVNAAQMNVVEFHTWNSVVKRIDKPNRLILDLDPGEGVKWAHVQEAAQLARGLLLELGLDSWLKTSGGKGLHVVVPLASRHDYETVKGFSQAVVNHLARTIPSRFVAKSGGSNRVGKIFVDWIRNGQSQTTVSAFSARARPGLGVSMPIAWEQLAELKSGSYWTIKTAREHVSFEKNDPWAGYWISKQTLTVGMKRLGYEPKSTAAGSRKRKE